MDCRQEMAIDQRAMSNRKTTRRGPSKGVVGDRLIIALLGVALWGIHFGKATRKYNGASYPPMNAAFELMFSYGRIVALLCMAAALLVFILQHGSRILSISLGPAGWIATLNLYIAGKLLYYDNFDFSLPAIAVILASVVVFVLVQGSVELGVNRAEMSQRSSVALTLWICGALIVSTNLVAVMLHPDSALNDNLRMHGTTVNPQHLAMMCALVSPAFLYVILRSGIFSFIGIASFCLFCGAVVIVFYTGSRMGLGAVAVGLLVFFREYIAGSRVLQGIVCGLLLVPVILAVLDRDPIELVYDRFFVDRVDTRSGGWKIAWEEFERNPLFGTEPSEESRRLIFVENFFLAAASTGGIIAVFLAAGAIVGVIHLAWRVRRTLKYSSARRVEGNFYLSAIAVLIGVSMFEAALLGVMAAHTMIAYVVLGGATAFVSLKPRGKRISKTIRSIH